MQSGIDTLASHANWSRLYELLHEDRKSPFFSPEYYLAYKEVDEAPAYCFWGYRDDENFLFYPFLKKSIYALGYDLDQEYFDISGAYNYNGPLGAVSDPDFLSAYNTLLIDFLLNEHIVTELVRYCPISGNKSYHTYTEQIDVLDNVFVDLSHGIDYVWANSYTQKLRTSIRKGASFGLNSAVFWGKEVSTELVKKAYMIYTNTMVRNQAEEFYFFGTDFMACLIEYMPQNVLMIVTYYEQHEISFELVIYDGKLSFALMRGTESDFFRLNPNTFQTNEIFKHLVDKGISVYSMGGGASRNDSVFAFKKAFAKSCDNLFHIGTKVHYPGVYKQIQAQWRERFPQAAAMHANKIQGYRFQSYCEIH